MNKITLRKAIRTAVLATSGVAGTQFLQPKAEASVPVAGGCAIIIIAVVAIGTIRLFVKRCELIYKQACDPQGRYTGCWGRTARWWKEHPEWKTLPPDFTLIEPCKTHWETNSPPPEWCPPAQQSANQPQRVNIDTANPVSIGEAFYDDGPDGLLPEYVMLIRCTDGHPELKASWHDHGNWIFIEDRSTTEPVQIAEFEAIGTTMFCGVRFA